LTGSCWAFRVSDVYEELTEHLMARTPFALSSPRSLSSLSVQYLHNGPMPNDSAEYVRTSGTPLNHAHSVRNAASVKAQLFEV